MSPLTNIVLIGGSGRIGKFVTEELLRNPEFSVSTITRVSSTSIFPSGVKIIKVGDGYPEADMLSAFSGQDAVVSLVGFQAAAKQTEWVDIAMKAGVKRFIPSEFGSNAENEAGRQVFPMLMQKKKVTDYLHSKEGSGLTWTALATGLFFDFCLETGFLGYDIVAHKATIVDEGTARWSTSTRPTIAAAVARVLSKPEETANKYLYISSFETTMNEVLAALEKAAPEPKWEVSKASSEDYLQQGRHALATGDLIGMGRLASVVNLKSGHGNDFATEATLANDMLRLRKQSVEEVVASIVKGGK